MSTDLRRHFPGHVENFVGSWLWELANLAQNRIPDPVDYVEMRRKTFGADLTSTLRRLTPGREIPHEIYNTRPVRALSNAAADYACLTNDVFSYRKEIELDGELHNGVLVIQQFLDVDARRGLSVVADLMAARMRQFQHTVATELPALLGELQLEEPGRTNLLGYVEGLQDWMAGVLNWHRETERYKESGLRYKKSRLQEPPVQRWSFGPAGLGTAAARVGALAASQPFGAVRGRPDNDV
jgi:germacradienol/geosmin synthase